MDDLFGWFLLIGLAVSCIALGILIGFPIGQQNILDRINGVRRKEVVRRARRRMSRAAHLAADEPRGNILNAEVIE